jgi:hypothetical protein
LSSPIKGEEIVLRRSPDLWSGSFTLCPEIHYFAP